MTILKFYYPSNGEPQDEFMEDLWNEGNVSYLTHTRRVSHRGNPHIKGVFLLNDEAQVPPVFECVPLSHDNACALVSEFQQELSHENNGLEFGIPPR